MTPTLIPEPQEITFTTGFLYLPSPSSIKEKTKVIKDSSLKEEECKISITHDKITITVGSPRAEFYARKTLSQIDRQSGKHHLPLVEIHDWPDFNDRGILYDVTRGRVPKIEQLIQLADELSNYKVNQLQLYIEHAFKFSKHPAIHKGSSPLTPANIKKLDKECRKRHIELIPALASFGHMSNILSKPEYQHLAEDLGVGEYTSKRAAKMPEWFQGRKGWSLAPANKDTYKFLDSLFSELLPCFSSDKINVCCDEVWDMGLGQSRKMCTDKGSAGLFLYHVKKLRSLASKYDKKIMLWGDMLRKHPAIMKQLPKDIIVMDWAYEAKHKFNTIKKLTKSGHKTYACPGTSSWASLFPRIHEAEKNIHGFAKAGLEHGATGLLTTDWGDGGHYNFMEFSWHGYLYGAEQAWNCKATQETFTRRFCNLLLSINSPEFSKAVTSLGNITHPSIQPWYQSIWQHVLFAAPDNDIFHKETGMLTADLGAHASTKLLKIQEVFTEHAKEKGADPLEILPYWAYAIDCLICATNKLAMYGPGGSITPAKRAKLRKELRSLASRFEKLWLARNNRSEINITLKRFAQTISDC